MLVGYGELIMVRLCALVRGYVLVIRWGIGGWSSSRPLAQGWLRVACVDGSQQFLGLAVIGQGQVVVVFEYCQTAGV